MKALLLIHLLLVAALYGCRELKPDPVRGFIPGTYIRFSRHEFGTEHDTLTISVQNKNAGEYKIIRRWKYERVIDGEIAEPEYKLTVTTGFYQSKHKLLRENETGSVYTFDVNENILFNGPVKYKKL
ncbi:MAG: hypothetical protein J0I32_11010 [Sphingobacteriales bacterium]|nr:hypothetical protein [Sphingobacteriales bacterium]OJW01189.1 MAG: hypothetical protein BGO52_07090 [Sphingobacteriales bacterium 44-61]